MSQYTNQILLVLFLAFAAFLGTRAKRLYQQFVTTKVKQDICKTAVRFVEQVYKDIHGPDKLRKAMLKASDLLSGYGITISEAELIVMLEAAVNEFNNSFSKTEMQADDSLEMGADY